MDILVRFARLMLAVLFIGHTLSINAQLTSAEAGYLDAVADFGADNTGNSVTTVQLQAAIDAATTQHKPLYLPPGTYLIDNTLVVEDDAGGDRDAQNTFITGSSVDPGHRSVIFLKEGTFPEGGASGHVIRHYGFGDEKYTDTFNRMLQSIDIVIGENNANAIGLRWRGAEGCAVFDINIDVTGGLYGMEMLPGSGGSIADIDIKGGKVGIFLGTNAVQPTPTITHITMSGQTEKAIHSDHTRGALTITGGVFQMNTGVPVFDLARHTGLTWSPGGNPVLTDCIIRYDTIDAENQVMVMVDNRDHSVQFSNVYVKNAAVILNEDEKIVSNADGWRYYKDLSYNSGWDENPQGDEPIYLDGIRQSGNVYEVFEDGLAPPENLQSRHGWGDTFPSFNSVGAVNVLNYEAFKNGGDWSPAFNAAIEEAENSGSNVVFVPVGNYTIYNTIDLKEHTALVGAGHQNSRIFGMDVENNRFGGAIDGWINPQPMIRTPDINDATCILADIAVQINTPFNNDAHTPVPMACYALLWRAGNHSIIRNIDYHIHNTNYYRSAFVLTNNIVKQSSLNLRNISSPARIGNYTFASYCQHAYHTGPVIPSEILVETVRSDKRIMVRSLPPARMNAVRNFYKIPNLVISHTEGELFTLHSLKLANSSPAPADGTDVMLFGYGAVDKDTVISLEGLYRTDEMEISLHWEALDSVVVLSDRQFSVDDVVMDDQELSFEGLSGSTFTAGEDFDHWCIGYGFLDLPIWVMTRPYVTITGGCKYYNHWIHGSTWMRVSEPYLLIKDNDPEDIVSIYHTHAQHSENFYKIKAENAHNVSLYGIKTENSLEFAHAENCDNFRVFGHGGMTNPPRGVAHYRIEESRNVKIVSTSDEVIETSDECRNCGLGDAMLPRTTFGYYDDIQQVDHQVLYKPDPKDSPILYRWGNPHDPWTTPCETQYTVTVEEGTGGGSFCPGDRVTLRTDLPACAAFSHWSGDTDYLDDSLSSTVVISHMPSKNLVFTPVYTDIASYRLEVKGGQTSADYCDQSLVSIEANPAAEGMIFSHWSGDTEYLNDSLLQYATVFMDGTDIFLEAVYEELIRPFSGTPTVIPGTIRAEYYDRGGEGVAYHEADSNRYKVFRNYEDVDVQLVPGSESDYYIDAIEGGEWIEYSVNSLVGRYEMGVVFGSGNTNGKMHMLVGGQKVTESISFPLSGGYTVFDTVLYYPVNIPAGDQIIRVFSENRGFSLDALIFRELVEYDLVVTISGEGSVLPAERTFRQGTAIELEAIPEDGYVFDRWGEDINTEQNPYTLVMDGEKHVAANFIPVDTTSIEDFYRKQVKIFPNPFTEGTLFVQLPMRSSVRIYNMQGDVIYAMEEASQGRVDRSSFQPGIYLLRVENMFFTDHRKILVI